MIVEDEGSNNGLEDLEYEQLIEPLELVTLEATNDFDEFIKCHHYIRDRETQWTSSSTYANYIARHNNYC